MQARDRLSVEPDSEIVQAYNRSDKSQPQDMGKGISTITGCMIIFLSELLLFGLVIVVIIIWLATDYDGYCTSFRPPPTPCSFEVHMRGGAMVMIPFVFMILGLKYWWITLLLLIIFPMIGMKISALITQRAK